MVVRRKTIGEELEAQLKEAIREASNAPLPGARDLPILLGLKAKGGFSLSVENVLLQATEFVVGSGRIYRYGDSIVLQVQRLDRAGSCLIQLRIGGSVEVGAEDQLANLFLCQQGDEQFAVPKSFVDLLLRSELLIQRLPHILHYATRPVFDDEFVLRGPGWHSSVGILVHGPEIEPVPILPTAPSGTAIVRLPLHLRTLLSGFCFQSDADVANFVGLLLTGVLMNHFMDEGKALALIDGNQPSLGKTLAARVAGAVLDGIDPRKTMFTSDDEELQKRLCASLRDSRQSLLLIDNAKTRGRDAISSPTIEVNSTASEISLRILGRSENLTCPNDRLWVLTMNNTRAGADMVARSFPIQLHFEGVPEEREFDGSDPMTYAMEHRTEILAELFGMIICWNQQGRPRGCRSHRLHKWAAIIGGILQVVGLPEFLENAAAVAASFNTDLEELAAVAEAAITGGGPFVLSGENPSRMLTPTDWAPYFRSATVLTEDMEGSKGTKARAIRIGQFLSPKVGRQVPIQVDKLEGKATLRSVTGRAKEKRYWLEVEWDNAAATAPPAKKVAAKKNQTAVRREHSRTQTTADGSKRNSQYQTRATNPTTDRNSEKW